MLYYIYMCTVAGILNVIYIYMCTVAGILNVEGSMALSLCGAILCACHCYSIVQCAVSDGGEMLPVNLSNGAPFCGPDPNNAFQLLCELSLYSWSGLIALVGVTCLTCRHSNLYLWLTEVHKECLLASNGDMVTVYL